MAIRDLDRRLRNLDSSDTTTPTPLTDSLINNDQFNYAHLVKFEKPTNDLLKGKTSRNANTYSYITDSAFDISWDDFSVNAKGVATGTQLYNANKLTKVGTVTETTDAKASGISITLDCASLGASVSFAGIAVTSTTVLCQSGVDLVEEGFREGDKVELTTTNGNAGKGYAIIKEFQDNNRKFTYTASAEGALVAGTEDATKFHTISLASEEIHALLLNKSHTTYTTYLNREVFIYKAHLDPDTNAIIGDPYLLFKGIIASGSIKEDPSKGSSITWGLTSHWGDFSRVSGRLTVDDAHRALDGNGEPDTEALIRPEYGSDLGFAHANQSLNVMATYNDIEISYKQVDINGGWFGGKRLREVETEVERRTDLAFNLSPKYLPVVYGVQKLDSIPIFVDTDNNDASQIYVAYAICEGPIAGILDLYIDGNSSICVDKADFDLRSTAGDTVDFVCKGRMDRGDALTGYNANTSTGVDGSGFLDLWGNYGRRGPLAAAYRQANMFTQAYSTSASIADSDTGILHEKTHTITSPLDGHFQIHVGKPDQKANPTLTGKAASSGFKIQNDYFDGDGEYWGNQHQLLDTAYTVGKFTIAAGETSIPEIDFIVRGKGVKCHNYDRAYNKTNSIVYTSAAKTNFNLGDTVALKRASNNAVIAASVTIIDKWDFLDADGATQTRFITDYATDIVNTHYMLKGTDRWYMSPDDPSDDITSTVATPAKTTVTSSSANSGGNGVDVVLASSAAFRAAVAAAIAAAGGWVLTFNGTSLPALSEAEFRDIAFNTSSNTLSGVGDGTEVSSLPDTITEVFVKNAIILNSTHSQSDAYYAGKTITLTRFDSDDVPYSQVKTITSYTNSGNTAIVDSPWVAGFMPDAGDTYVISASKPDIRVSINPALQLLDYLTSERYGRGLDLDLDIDLPTFKEAARLCDTRSKVTVAVPYDSPVLPGDVYEYAPSGVVHFRGTVESENLKKVNGTANAFKEVVFKNVIGKLGHKFNTWEEVRVNELIWHSTGNLYQIDQTNANSSASGGYTLDSGDLITALELTKVGGGTALVLDLSQKSDNGNPLAKSWVPYSSGDTTGTGDGDFRGTGYTLYDSDDIKYWKYIGWDSNGQRNVTRHQMNQTIATANPIFDNVNLMLKQFNGILRYSNGRYQLDVRGQSPNTFVVGEVIEEADIIGSISLKDKGVKKTYNSVSTSIKDPQTKFESRSVSFFNSTYLKQDKSIPKKGNYGCPGITNYFNARFNINQMLDESRYGLTISFKMAPKGILLLPGSIIRLNYDRFGWVNKEFRIASIAAGTDCLVNITADEHNNDAFLIKSLAEPAVGGAIATGSIQNRNSPSTPQSLTASTGTKGAVNLAWTNASTFDPNTYASEVWYATTNDRNHASFKFLHSTDTDAFSHVVTDQSTQTYYYWIVHKIKTDNNKYVKSLYFPTSITGGITGSATGAIDGNPALSAILTASQYVIPYTLADTESTTITLTATATNFEAGNRTYKFYVDNVLKQTTTNTLDTHTFVLADGDEPANGSQKTIKLEIIQGSTTAIDSTSIYGVKDGESAFTVVFTNEAHTISADEGGAPLTFANSGTDIRVFKGSTRLTYATSGANTFEVAVLSDTDITVNASPTTEQFAIANDTRRYGPASGMANADTSASITYSITARSDDAIDTVLTKVQSFTKGNAGPGAKVVNLTASQYVIPYDLANDETTTITLTATAKNISGSKIYKIYVNNTLIPGTGTTGGTQTTTGNAVTCNIPQNLEPSHGEQITVRVDVIQASAIISSDSTSIYGIKDGDDSFTAILTNEAHAIAASFNGTPKSFADSGTDIRVFHGSTALTYGTGPSNFSVSAAPSGITVGNASTETFGVSNDTRRFASASGMANSASKASIVFTITARNQEGVATTLVKVQSFTKGKDGTGISSVTKSNDTVTVTFEDNTTDTFTVNGVTSVAKSGNTLTITYDDGSTSTIDDGTQGNGISNVTRSGETVTVTYDDSTTQTFTVADGTSAVSGDPEYVTVSNIKKNAAGTYTVSFLDIDYIFRQGSSIVAKRRYRVTRSADTWSTTVATRDQDTSDELNVSRLTPALTISNNNAVLKVAYSDGSIASSASAPVSVILDGLGISSVGKVGDTITVTYDNSSTDTFTVNGVASVAKSGDTLTITYDDGSTSTIDDGEQGNGIASISKSGETVTVTFDDNSSTTFSVADGAASVSGDPDYVVSSAITKNTSGVYSANHLDLDFTFREGGATTLAKRRYRIARSSNTWATSVTARDADISDELNVSRLTPTVTVTGQNAVVKVTYSHGGVTSTASAPVSIANDAIGTKTVQLFKKDDSTFLNTTAGNYASPTTGVDSGWTTTQETPANGEAIYMVSRTFNSDGLNQSNWSAPIIVAQRTDGTTPAPGAPGLRTIQGYLYYEKNSANAPADPSGTTYTFSTGLVSGGSGATEVVAPVNTAVNKWTNSPRTQDPTSSHDHYTIRYFGTESSASSSTITVTYSDAVPYTNFDGVVTFSNGTFKEGTANITTIDGGNISTGTIDAHRLSVGKTAAQLQAEGLTVGSRVLLLEDSLKIFSGTTLRVHIGNLSNTDT